MFHHTWVFCKIQDVGGTSLARVMDVWPDSKLGNTARACDSYTNGLTELWSDGDGARAIHGWTRWSYVAFAIQQPSVWDKRILYLATKTLQGQKLHLVPPRVPSLTIFDLIFEAATHLWKNNDQTLVGSGVVIRLDRTGTRARRSAWKRKQVDDC